MLDSHLGRLRVVGFVEGVSYLVLLGIAMPMKYLAGLPLAVRYTGWAHGILFILYIAAVVLAAFAHRWPVGRAVKALVASLIPFGTFVLEREWRQEHEAANLALQAQKA